MSFYLSVYLSTYLSIYQSIYISVYLYICIFISLTITWLYIYLFICVYLYIYLYIFLYIYLSINLFFSTVWSGAIGILYWTFSYKCINNLVLKTVANGYHEQFYGCIHTIKEYKAFYQEDFNNKYKENVIRYMRTFPFYDFHNVGS